MNLASNAITLVHDNSGLQIELVPREDVGFVHDFVTFHVIVNNRELTSSSVNQHLFVDIVWNLARKVDSVVNNLLSPQWLEVWFWTADCQFICECW